LNATELHMGVSGRGPPIELGISELQRSGGQAQSDYIRDFTGHGWECDRGYYKHGTECLPVVVPAHASLDHSGHGWTCDQGYQRVGNDCVMVIVPPNASLDYSGTAWECHDGYVRRGERCIGLDDATDDEVRELMIAASIAAYPGNCPCPYNTDRAGRRCGGRSAYSRPGGHSPLCYKSDISDEMVTRFRSQYQR
jgi:hypothetical protein